MAWYFLDRQACPSFWTMGRMNHPKGIFCVNAQTICTDFQFILFGQHCVFHQIYQPESTSFCGCLSDKNQVIQTTFNIFIIVKIRINQNLNNINYQNLIAYIIFVCLTAITIKITPASSLFILIAYMLIIHFNITYCQFIFYKVCVILYRLVFRNYHKFMKQQIQLNVLSRNLLQAEAKQRQQPAPKIDYEWRKTIFLQNNIKSGQSAKMFNKIGGLPGLVKTLKTNLQNGIAGDQKVIDSRKQSFQNNQWMLECLPKTAFSFARQFLFKRYVIFQLIFIIFLVVEKNCSNLVPIQQLLHLFAIVLLGCCSVFCSIMKQNLNLRLKIFKTENGQQIISKYLNKQKLLKILRNGKIVKKPGILAVPGDIIQLQFGDSVMGDAIIIKSESAQIIQNNKLKKKIPFSQQLISQRPFEIGQSFIGIGSTFVSKKATILLVNNSLHEQQGVKFLFQQIFRPNINSYKKLNNQITLIKQEYKKQDIKVLIFIFILWVLKLIFTSTRNQPIMLGILQIIEFIGFLAFLNQIQALLNSKTAYLSAKHQQLSQYQIQIRNQQFLPILSTVNCLCVNSIYFYLKGPWKIKSIFIGNYQLYTYSDQNMKLINQTANKKFLNLFLPFIKIVTELGITNTSQQAQNEKDSGQVIMSSKFCLNSLISYKYYLVKLGSNFFAVAHANFDAVFNHCSYLLQLNGEKTLISQQLRNRMKTEKTERRLTNGENNFILCYRQVANLQKFFEKTYQRQFFQSNFIICVITNESIQYRQQISSVFRQLNSANIHTITCTRHNVETSVGLCKKSHYLPDNFQIDSESQVVMQFQRLEKLFDEINFKKETKYEKCQDIRKLKQILSKIKLLCRVSIVDSKILIKALKLARMQTVLVSQVNDYFNGQDITSVMMGNKQNDPSKKFGTMQIPAYKQFASIPQIICFGRSTIIYLGKFVKFYLVCILSLQLILIKLIIFFDHRYLMILGCRLVFTLIMLGIGGAWVFTSIPIYKNIIHQTTTNLPILNTINLVRMLSTIISHSSIIVLQIILMHLNWPFTLYLQSQEVQQYVKASIILRTYFFLQLISMLMCLENNNYDQEIEYRYLPTYLIENKKSIQKVLILFFVVQLATSLCYNLCWAVFSYFDPQKIISIDLLFCQIGTKWYMISIGLSFLSLPIFYLLEGLALR